MSQKSSVPHTRVSAEKLLRDIRCATCKHHSAEDKISIVQEGLDLSRIYAALIAHLGCLAFENQGAFASQR
jgi:hypothetical protein